jgi:ankyrin repeat protein
MIPGYLISLAMMIVAGVMLSIGIVLLLLTIAGWPKRLANSSRTCSSCLLLLGLTFAIFSTLLDKRQDKQLQALTQAIASGNGLKVCKMVTNNPHLCLADLSQFDDGEPLLHRAIHSGQIGILVVLISSDVLPNLEVTDANGDTPLLLALREKQRFMVSTLLSRGANPDVKDRSGHTARELAHELGPDYVRFFDQY